MPAEALWAPRPTWATISRLTRMRRRPAGQLLVLAGILFIVVGALRLLGGMPLLVVGALLFVIGIAVTGRGR